MFTFSPSKAGAGALILLSAGCGRAPQIGILGSFFPAWLPCAIAGVVLTFGIYSLLNRLRLAQQLAPALLVYPAIAVLLTVALWLALFS